MQDDLTLSDYKIKKELNLHLVLSLLGGVKNESNNSINKDKNKKLNIEDSKKKLILDLNNNLLKSDESLNLNEIKKRKPDKAEPSNKRIKLTPTESGTENDYKSVSSTYQISSPKRKSDESESVDVSKSTEIFFILYLIIYIWLK